MAPEQKTDVAEKKAPANKEQQKSIVVELSADTTGIMEALDNVERKIDLVSKKMNDLREMASQLLSDVKI